MKKLFLIFAMCCLCGGAFAQSELYKKFADMDGVEAVYIPNIKKGMYSMVSNNAAVMKEMKNVQVGSNSEGMSSMVSNDAAVMKEMNNIPLIPSNMEKLIVLSSEKKEVIEKMKKEIAPMLRQMKNDNNYELILDSKSDGERTSIYKNQKTGEMLIINDDADEFQIVQLFGDFSDKK